MKTLFQLKKTPTHTSSQDGLNVLLVGNNPIEMSKIYDQLKSLKEKISNIDISFDDKETLAYVTSHHPNYIIIDDNYGTSPIKRLLESLRSLKDNSASIMLLKSKNTSKAFFGFQEYLMKDSLTAERLYQSLLNGLKFRKTRAFLKGKLKMNA